MNPRINEVTQKFVDMFNEPHKEGKRFILSSLDVHFDTAHKVNRKLGWQVKIDCEDGSTLAASWDIPIKDMTDKEARQTSSLIYDTLFFTFQHKQTLPQQNHQQSDNCPN